LLKQQKASLEAQNHAAELKLRAERKLGEILGRTVESHRPGKLSHDATVLPEGVRRDQSSRWQKVATIPHERFADFIRDTIRGRGAGPPRRTAGRTSWGTRPGGGRSCPGRRPCGWPSPPPHARSPTRRGGRPRRRPRSRPRPTTNPSGWTAP